MKTVDYYLNWTKSNSYWFIIPSITFYKNKEEIRLAFMWLKFEIGIDLDIATKRVYPDTLSK